MEKLLYSLKKMDKLLNSLGLDRLSSVKKVLTGVYQK